MVAGRQAREYMRNNRPPSPPAITEQIQPTGNRHDNHNRDRDAGERNRSHLQRSRQMTEKRRRALFRNRKSIEELTTILIHSKPVKMRHNQARYAFDVRGRIYKEYYGRIRKLIIERYRANPSSVPKHLYTRFIGERRWGLSPDLFLPNEEDEE
jgi:hypothetical protein